MINLADLATIVGSLYRQLTSPIPTMNADWNVAVAGFSLNGSSNLSTRELNRVGQVFYTHLQADLHELAMERGLTIEVWPPEQTGRIEGETPLDRHTAAMRRTTRINANIIIFGTVVDEDGILYLQPEFYVSDAPFDEMEEMVGHESLGSPILLDLPVPEVRNTALSNRSQVLSLAVQGLIMFSLSRYEEALQRFERANVDALWLNDEGREVLEIYVGNAALRAGLLEKAEEAYSAALALRSSYTRAFTGLGSVYYLHSLSLAENGDIKVDRAFLQQSLDHFQKAVSTLGEDDSAITVMKVAIGLGQVYFLQWETGQAEVTKAINQFNQVLAQYVEMMGQNGANSTPLNPSVQDIVAEAHGYLGLIEMRQGNTAKAIVLYEQAVQLCRPTSSARKASFLSVLADLYRDQNQLELARETNERAIAQYNAAQERAGLSEKRRAELLVGAARRHEQLGQLQEAAAKVVQAIRLVPEQSPEHDRYLQLLHRINQKRHGSN